jgi:quinol monooxygenase YgiN
MAKVIVQHHVADYDRWFPVFIEHGEVRRRHGATGHTVYRTAADPNTVLIVNDFASVADAQAFLQDPSLPEAMARAGVDVAPQVWIVDEAHAATY